MAAHRDSIAYYDYLLLFINMKKLALILIPFLLLSCATMKSWLKPVAKYDQKSYESFTSLKANLKAFIDTMSPATEPEKIDSFYLLFDVVYEYEKGKGLGNQETVSQLELLKKRIDDFILEAQGREISQAYRDAKKETLCRILDVIISTEYIKPR